MIAPALLAAVLRGGSRDAWQDLDRRTALLREESSATRWGALLRAFYTLSDEETSLGSADVSGLVLEDVDLFLEHGGDELSWRVSVDADSDQLQLEDAQARFTWATWLDLRVGQFKPRVVRSALSRRLGPSYEAAARWQRADDASDAEALGVALDWSPGAGLVRWVADATHVDSEALDSWLLSIGLGVGTSGLPDRPSADRR